MSAFRTTGWKRVSWRSVLPSRPHDVPKIKRAHPTEPELFILAERIRPLLAKAPRTTRELCKLMPSVYRDDVVRALHMLNAKQGEHRIGCGRDNGPLWRLS